MGFTQDHFCKDTVALDEMIAMCTVYRQQTKLMQKHSHTSVNLTFLANVIIFTFSIFHKYSIKKTIYIYTFSF